MIVLSNKKIIKTVLLIIFISIIITFRYVKKIKDNIIPTSVKNVENKTIVLDAGHGGEDRRSYS